MFQCILKLFENEVAHGGHPGSILTHTNAAATNGFMNSQTDSIFNSKHNISELDSNVGMSFGRAIDDGNL